MKRKAPKNAKKAPKNPIFFKNFFVAKAMSVKLLHLCIRKSNIVSVCNSDFDLFCNQTY